MANLRQGVRPRQSNVLLGHHLAAHHDLADLAVGHQQIVRPGLEGFVGNADHFERDARQRAAYAGSAAPAAAPAALVQHLAPVDGRDRQRFGRAVGCVDVSRRTEDLVHSLDQLSRDRRPGDQHAPQGRQRDPPLDAMAADPIPDRRRTERVGHRVVPHRLDDSCRIDLGRFTGVHVRYHAGHAHGGAEQGEQRKRRQVHFARLDVVARLNGAYLRVEHAVLVNHALSRSGAARGEQDGGGFVRPRGHHLEIAPGALFEGSERRPAPEPAPPNGDGELHRPKRSWPKHAHGLGRRDTHQRLRFDRANTLEHAAHAHARVDQNRHRAHLEQGEDQPDELQPRPHHHQHARTAPDAGAAQAVRVPVRLGLEFVKRQLGVLGVAVASAPGGHDYGRLIRDLPCHPRQVRGDVAGVNRRRHSVGITMTKLGFHGIRKVLTTRHALNPQQATDL